MEIRKKVTFLYIINNLIIYKFFKHFTNHRMKTNRAVVFSCRPFPNILKYRDHWWELPTNRKTRLFQTHIEEVSMYESSGSRFFRTTIEIQSGPDAFDESRFITNFFTILKVTEILCSFRLVLEGKLINFESWAIKIRVLRNVFSKKCCFIRCSTPNLLAVE